MEVLEEDEEEEAGRSQDHTAKKGAHTYHPSVISCPWSFGGVVHNQPRVAHIFQWDESCVVARPQTPKTRSLIPIGAPIGWDTMDYPQVLSRSVGEFVHLIFFGSTRRSCLHPQIRIKIRVGRRIIPVSLP
jgi:hypothetical protein